MSAPVGEWLLTELRKHGFLHEYPHYAAALAHWTPIDDPAVQVMGVSCSRGKFYLHVNRSYFADHAELLPGIVLHEIHHIVMGHVTHPKFNALPHPDRLTLAMEMSANEDITEELPPHVDVRDFAHLGIRPDQSTLERYELLKDAPAREVRKAGERGGAGNGTPLVDDHSGWAEEEGKPRKRDEATERAGEAFREAIEQARSGASGGPSSASRQAGTEPGEERRELEDASGRPIDWRLALRRFVRLQRTRSFDYSRPNRRFLDRIGEVPGRVRRPKPVKPVVVAAIDTSASMSEFTLSEISAQLHALSERADIVVVECDSELGEPYRYEGRIDYVMGGGGTDLRPLFESEVLSEVRANGVIYFTDGMGPFPEEAASVPTLWVLTPDAPEFGCAWGDQVRMD